MYCNNCGEENVNGGRFCFKCGAPLIQKASPQANEASQPQVTKQETQEDNASHQGNSAQAPQGYAQPPQGYAQAPQGYAQAPQGYAQAPQGYAQPPQGYAQPPQGYAQASQGYAQAPQGYAQAPQGYAQAPQQKPSKPKKEKKPRKRRSTSLALPIIAICVLIAIAASSICFEVFGAAAEEKVSPLPQAGEVNTVENTISYDTDKINKPTVTVAPTTPSTQPNAEIEQEITFIDSKIDESLIFINSAYSPITTENAYVYVDAVAEMAYSLRSEGLISDVYVTYGSSVRIKLNSGMQYLYAPQIVDTKAGASGEAPTLYIGSYHPYDSQFGSSYTQIVIDGGHAVDDAFTEYVYKENGRDDKNDDAFLNKETSIESVLNMGKYNYILWDGHGDYDSSYGPVLLIKPESGRYLYNEFTNEEIFLSQNGQYYLTYKFFENRLADNSLDNTVVVLGACYSGKNNRLANAFLNKGAEAVVGFDNPVYVSYCNDFMLTFSKELATESNGAYNSVKTAFENTKAKKGNADDAGTRPVLYAKNESFTLDWFKEYVTSDREVVLVLDRSGSMGGDAITQTKAAASKFVESISEDFATIGLVSYSSGCEKLSGFTANKSLLKEKIEGMYASGGTNISGALAKAKEMLDETKATKKIIILMTDGLPNEGLTGDSLVKYAEELRGEGIMIYTLGFFQNLSTSEKKTTQPLLQKMADSGCHYEVSDISDIEYIFGDIAEQVKGQRYIYIRIACPVDVTVSYGGATLSSSEKKQSLRTDFGTLHFENATGEEISEETDDKDVVKVLRLKAGTEYDIDIQGTGKGKMNYSISFMDENGDYTDTRDFKNIKITRDTEITTTAAEVDKTVLEVDEDGDGEVDFVYSAKVGKKAELQEEKTSIFVYIAIASGAVSLVFVAMLVIRIIRRKRYRQEDAEKAQGTTNA